MGTGMAAEIDRATHGTSLRISGCVDHLAHAGLNQSTCAHRAGLKRDHQGAVVKTPVPPQSSCLTERYQFSVSEGVLVGFTDVAPEANTTGFTVQNDGTHRHFSLSSDGLGPPQESAHPEALLLICQGDR